MDQTRTSIASSTYSSSSGDSSEQASRRAQPQKGHKKGGSFSKFFSVKEPSAAAFQQLAELQQKELAQKGQKLPFGVPAKKLPESAKDDYKNAKQRAKERAKLHEAVKEQLKMQDDHEQYRHHSKPSTGGSVSSENAFSAYDFAQPPPVSSSPHPKSPKSSTTRSSRRPHKQSSLDSLPEVPSVDTMIRQQAQLPPSPPISHHSRSTSSKSIGVLTGSARKGALPWE